MLTRTPPRPSVARVQRLGAMAALYRELAGHIGVAAHDARNLVARDCPVCAPGRGAPEPHPRVRGAVYDFHRCTACDVRFTPRVLRPALMRKLYGERPIYRTYWDHMKADADASIGREIYGRLVPRLCAASPGAELAVDVGCGFGKLASELSPHFARVLGLELNRRTAQAGVHMFGVDIRSKHLDALALPAGSVDLIVMNRLLEHLTDVRGLVAEAYRVLKPRGALYVGVPHGASLGLRVIGGAHENVATHMYVNLFTAPALRRLGEDAGFQVRALGTDDTIDLSAADLMIRRLTPGGRGSLLAAPALAFDELVRAVAARARLPSRLGIGASLEAIFVKPEATT